MHLRWHMRDDLREKYEDELDQEAADIWEQVLADESLQDVKAPSDMRENVFQAIRAQEAERARAQLSDEDKELLRLGRIYRRKRKNRKFLVLAAAMILTLALGITSFGDGEKIFRMFTTNTGGGEQVIIDSEDMIPNDEVTEEEVYTQIQEEYGFMPVRMTYLPEDMEYIRAIHEENTQKISIYYGIGDSTRIKYVIRPNYRDGSWNQFVGDELVEEYEINKDGMTIMVRKCLVEDEMWRWMVMFEHRDVGYLLVVDDLTKVEVEKVIESLYLCEN